MREEILEQLQKIACRNIIDIDTIPNIDLYVDQVITFISANIFSNTENHLTKSMINNYSKNKVIPPAIKKKYDKNHILLLIMIYQTKNILSIQEIGKIFTEITDTDVTGYYSFLSKHMRLYNEKFVESTLSDFDKIIQNDLPDKNKIALLATQLAVEANYKKMLAEMLIEKYL